MSVPPAAARIAVPARPAILRVAAPAHPAVVRDLVPGIPGPGGPAGPAGPDPGVSAFTAGQDLGGQRVIGLGVDGSAIHASADDPDHILRVLGISTGAAALGAMVTVRGAGEMTDPSWSWLPGPVWCGLFGALTQVLPELPDAVFRQQVAFAVSPIRILVGLRMAVRLA